MKKAKKFFTVIAFISVLIFFAGPSSLLSQTAKEEKKQEPAINNLTQAKTDAQAKEEQEKAEARKAAAQALAEAQAKAEQQRAEIAKNREAEQANYEPVLKTYSLKYISVAELISAAKFYIWDYTGSENALTVRISKMNIPPFEDLLKKLDIEKKNIRFRVFSIIASREPISKGESEKEGSTRIENKDLKKVLDEMTGVWNFKYFRTEDPSFLIVKNGSGSNSASLLSRFGLLNLTIVQPQIRGEKAGERIIAAKQIRLVRTANFTTDTPIDTQDIIIKENGYLVVGVGSAGGQQAIILILSAEII